MPWRDAVAAAERGEIADAKSIVGLFWLARLPGRRLSEPRPVRPVALAPSRAEPARPDRAACSG